MRGWIRLCGLAALVAWTALAPAAATAPEAARRDLHLTGPAPLVFEQLGRLYGVRVQVDSGLPPKTLRLRLSDVAFPDALRVATQLAGAFSVTQGDGSVLVAEDTAPNRTSYLPQVTQTFVLPGHTPDELEETLRLLREVLDMNRIQSDAASSAFTVRDTPRRLAVADQLLRQLVGEPGEIWLDVLLLEVNRDRAQNLGLLLPDSVAVQHLSAGDTSYVTVLPGATLRLEQLAGASRSRRRVSLRARDAEEATIFAGEQFPVILATFSSSFISPLEQDLRDRGEFVPPVPATRYEELGVRVTVHPRLHSSEEVTLALKIAQKALTGQEVNGIPILSNRSVEQQVRLQEGETLLIGGLRGRTEQVASVDRTVKDSSAQMTELIILVTPHLVRLPAPDRLALRALYVGTESEFAPAGGPALPPGLQLPQPTPPPGVRPPARPQPPPAPEEEEEKEEEEEEPPLY